MSEAWPWVALGVLGAYHGINPAMGWLFAVARGLQENRRSAVLAALPAIAVGHAAAIAVFVLLVDVAETATTPTLLRGAGAGVLIAFGAFKLLRPRSHPRWVAMRVSLPELGLWSFLMASAHGAGLMLFPLLVALPGPAGAEGATVLHLGAHSPALLAPEGALAVAIHSIAMLGAMALVALVVYEKVGLAFLRRAWVNVDLIWAITFFAAGLFTLIA